MDAAVLAREEKQQMQEARFNKRGRIDNARTVRLLVAGTFLRLADPAGALVVLMGTPEDRARCAASPAGAVSLKRDACFIGLRSLEVFESSQATEAIGVLGAAFLVSSHPAPPQSLSEQAFVDSLLSGAKPVYFNPYLEEVTVDRTRGMISVLDRTRIQSYRELARAGLAVYAGDPGLDPSWRTSWSTATT